MTFDLERMKRAMASPLHHVPDGLSRDEIRAFILQVAASAENRMLAEPAGDDNPVSRQSNPHFVGCTTRP